MLSHLTALLLLASGLRAHAQDCVPAFLSSEPRDAQWFYGAGKGADAQAAREDALQHLFLKVTGGQADIPRDVLAGWEQDDHGQCRGKRYALVRIEKERAKRNLADALARKAGATDQKPVVVNNISVAPPAPGEDHDLKYVVLLLVFLGFVVGCVALVKRPWTHGSAGPPFVRSVDVRQTPSARRQAGPASRLTERFRAIVRQPQNEAMSEVAKTGIPAYLRAHKGEGTCKSISGSEDVVHDGVAALARRYESFGWKLTEEPWAFFAVRVDGSVAMGYAFFLYASAQPGYADCEILFASNAPVQDTYRTQMEESLHQGLPGMVQAAAMEQGAARSREEGPA